MNEIKLSPCETIVDENKFVEAHTATIERNMDNPYFEAYKERMEKYKQLINGRVFKSI